MCSTFVWCLTYAPPAPNTLWCLTYTAPPAPHHVQNSFSKFRKNRRQELRHKAYVSKDKGRRSTVEKDRLRLKFLDACKSYVC